MAISHRALPWGGGGAWKAKAPAPQPDPRALSDPSDSGRELGDSKEVELQAFSPFPLLHPLLLQ